MAGSLLSRSCLFILRNRFELLQLRSFKSTDDPGYKRLLAGVRVGAQQLAEGKRFDMPGFRPNRFYIREMKRYGVLPASADRERDSVDPYATDRRYWESMWHKPVVTAGDETQ